MTKQLAGCVISNTKGQVLLIHRNTARLSQWELPGGKVEVGETLQQAAVREVYEEVGIKVKPGRHLGNAEFDDNNVHWRYAWIEATLLTGKPHVKEPAIHDAVGYFDLLSPDIYHINVSVNIKALIDALNKKLFTL